MNRQTSVAMPEITPRVDIEKTYRQLMCLRRMVKHAESLQGRLGEKPRDADMSVLSLTTALIAGRLGTVNTSSMSDKNHDRAVRYRRLALAEPDAEEGERGVLCTVDQNHPAPEATGAKPLNP
jgi:hypothetical protein